MRRILALVSLLLGGGCASDTPHLTLPAAPACGVPEDVHAIHEGFECGPGWLAVDDTRVYWEEMSLTDGSVSTVAGDKCSSATLRLGPQPLFTLAPADGMLYGIDQSSFFAVPTDGRARVAIVNGFDFLAAMALDPTDDTALLGSSFTCSGGDSCTHTGTLWRVHRSGGVPETILPATTRAEVMSIAIAPDGFDLLGSIDDEPGGVYRFSRDGVIRQRLGGPDSMDFLVTDPVTGDLFVHSRAGIQRLDGTTFDTVWPAAPGDILSFVLDDRYIYAVFSDGHLGRRPRRGGVETVLLEGSVIAVGLDAAAVYAFDCTLGSGRILRLPR